MGYVPEMRLALSPRIQPLLRRLNASESRRWSGRPPTRAALGALLCVCLANGAQAESSVLLEPSADTPRIAAVTFDHSGTAVGESSFELEMLENGNQKMTVHMMIEGGGQNVSEAIFAPIPAAETTPTIAPAEKRRASVDPEGLSDDSSSLPSISSPPPSSPLPSQGPIAGLRLVEQRSQSRRADGTLFELLVIDHIAGVMRCTPDGAGPSQIQEMPLPKKDRVMNVPMQLFFLPLVRGEVDEARFQIAMCKDCLLYTSPSPRDQRGSRMPSSA